MWRAVITGLGVVSCIGNSKDEVLDALKHGRSGIVSNETFREVGLRSQVSGSCHIDRKENIDRKVLRFMGDAAAYAYISMRQAIEDAGLEDSEVSNIRTGLIAGSPAVAWNLVRQWNPLRIATMVGGAVLAFFLLGVREGTSDETVAQLTDPALLVFFAAGAIAICAMILPGISGAFILVLLGSYKTVLDAVHQRDLQVILVVGAGAAIGLLSFARLLKWMFSKFKNATLALLTGFIIGSLPKIWPWKVVQESRVFDGKEIPVRESVVAPWNYPEDPQWIPALGLAILGFSLIFILERLATRKNS